MSPEIPPIKVHGDTMLDAVFANPVELLVAEL
jgi:hypothetical protein